MLKTRDQHEFGDFLLNDLFSDVAVEYMDDNGEVVTVPAHKVVLAGESEWFDAALSRPTETIDAREIPDFKDILTWMYKRDLPFESYNKEAVSQYADFLGIPGLQRELLESSSVSLSSTPMYVFKYTPLQLDETVRTVIDTMQMGDSDTIPEAMQAADALVTLCLTIGKVPDNMWAAYKLLVKKGYPRNERLEEIHNRRRISTSGACTDTLVRPFLSCHRATCQSSSTTHASRTSRLTPTVAPSTRIVSYCGSRP
jgi:hypothetical protein